PQSTQAAQAQAAKTGHDAQAEQVTQGDQVATPAQESQSATSTREAQPEQAAKPEKPARQRKPRSTRPRNRSTRNSNDKPRAGKTEDAPSDAVLAEALSNEKTPQQGMDGDLSPGSGKKLQE